MPELGRELAGKIAPDTVLIAETPFIAGNLRLGTGGNRVICKAWGDAGGKPSGIVWDLERQPSPPADLLHLAGRGLRPDATRFTLEGKLRYQRGKTYSLGVLW